MRFRYLLLLLLLIVACGKDKAIVPEYLLKNIGNDTTGTSGPGTSPSTPTEPSPNLSDTYQPLTKGSNWKYAEIDEFNDTAWVTTTLTGKTISEGGKQFFEADNKYEGIGNDGITYFHSAGDLYIYRSEEGISGRYQNFEYLRSALAVNAKWEVS